VTPEENKDVVRRYIADVFNTGTVANLDDPAVADYVEHSPLPGQGSGLEGLRQRATILRTAFPDFHVTIEDLVAEGDKVAVRWTTRATHQGVLFGVPATGVAVTITGMDIYRVAAGKLAEHWDQVDLLGFLQQIGAIPVPGSA
jgi:steroid delta-isomerase-like uncharacterized protein